MHKKCGENMQAHKKEKQEKREKSTQKNYYETKEHFTNTNDCRL